MTNANDPPMPEPAGARLATRLAFLVAGFVMACWAPLVPFAKARVGADDATLGLLLLGIGIGSIVAMPVTGALAARRGSRSMILTGGIALALLLPMLAIVGSAAMLALALFGFGAALGTIDVAMNVHAVEVERRAGRPLMSGFHALFSIGGFAGAGGMTALLAAGLSPLPATLVAAVLALAALAVAAPRLLATRGEAAAFALPRGIVLLLAALAAVTFLVEGAILDWGALLVTGMGLVRLAQGGVGYMIFSVAMTAGRLAGDRAVRRLGEARILFWGGLVTAAGFAVVLTVPAAGVALAGFALVGLGASNIVPVLFSAAGRQTAMPAPLAIAAVTTTGYAGILAGPAGIGLVAQRIGLPGAFWLLAGLMILVTLASRRVVRG
jgi:predicted MFS family arabinose efflux permease